VRIGGTPVFVREGRQREKRHLEDGTQTKKKTNRWKKDSSTATGKNRELNATKNIKLEGGGHKKKEQGLPRWGRGVECLRLEHVFSHRAKSCLVGGR